MLKGRKPRYSIKYILSICRRARCFPGSTYAIKSAFAAFYTNRSPRHHVIEKYSAAKPPFSSNFPSVVNDHLTQEANEAKETLLLPLACPHVASLGNSLVFCVLINVQQMVLEGSRPVSRNFNVPCRRRMNISVW